MLGFQDHGDAKGVEFVHDRGRDLIGHAFLHLQAACEDIDEAGEF